MGIWPWGSLLWWLTQPYNMLYSSRVIYYVLDVIKWIWPWWSTLWWLTQPYNMLYSSRVIYYISDVIKWIWPWWGMLWWLTQPYNMLYSSRAIYYVSDVIKWIWPWWGTLWWLTQPYNMLYSRTPGNSTKSLVPIWTKNVDFRSNSWGLIWTKSDKIWNCPEPRAQTSLTRCQMP